MTRSRFYLSLLPLIIGMLLCHTAVRANAFPMDSDPLVVTLPPGFAQVRVAQGLDPTAMARTPDGRILITEKNGRVLIVENGILLPDPLVTIEVDNYNERGLSGIAVHPEFPDNGYFYLYYTVRDAGHNRISRFTAEGNHVVPGSEIILLDLTPLVGTIHNAGSMAFGPDGKLFISVGDGSSEPSVQRMDKLLGKVLRINDDGSIPEDNPFYLETVDEYRAIYALGFRNSFSMSIQPVTGRIFATEVGGGAYEEVNDIRAGKNYGWPIIEGPLAGQNPPDNYHDPVYAYGHGVGCAAVGAAFYNPETHMFPQEYVGQFFFADYCQGYIKYLDPDDPAEIKTFATGIARPLNLLVAPDGTMYYLARAGIGGGSEQDNTASTNGSLWRVFYTGNGSPFVAVNPESILISVGETAAFTIAVSGTQPLSYQWQRDGIDIPGANALTYILADAILSDSGSLFRCIVENNFGIDTTLEATLGVTTNQRPQAEILMPVAGANYQAGSLLEFSGLGLDPEEGMLDPEALRWRIDFHHNTHTHPAMAPIEGITAGTFYIPQVGETSANVWYRIHLSATDAGALTRRVSRDIFPLKTQIRVSTVPQGLPVYVESAYLVSPVTTPSVVGIIRRLEAIKTFVRGDSLLVFKEWLGGGTDPVLVFAAETDSITYTAIYEAFAFGSGAGVHGHYFDGPPFDPTFYEPPAFSRIDPQIDFDWGEGSPLPDSLGEDFWLVRWEGYIEPIVEDDYTFTVFSDDGSRLWVDDQLIMNDWVNHPPAERSGEIHLKGGQLYPIRLEYFESGGGALCRLSWSGNRLDKRTVPQSQLYPDKPVGTGESRDSRISVFPNPATDQLFVDLPGPVASVRFDIRSTLGESWMTGHLKTHGNPRFHIDIPDLLPGVYWLVCELPDGVMTVVPFTKM